MIDAEPTPEQLESGVRAWTDQLARIRFGVQQVNGKKITSATIKAVANRLATYADYRTGNRVRPGIARLAVDLEIGYQTVKNALAVIRRAGLLRLVSSGGREGGADVYQLVIPVDLLDREDFEVLSPAQQDLQIERIRTKVRGRPKAEMRVPAGPCIDPADDPGLQVPASARIEDGPPENAGAVMVSDSANAGAVGSAMQVPVAPATTHLPTTTEISQPMADLETSGCATSAREAVQDPIPIGQGKCQAPGCAKGWLLVGDALARCRCNPPPAEPAPDPPPNGGAPPPEPSSVAAASPPDDPALAPAGAPQLRVIHGGLAA